MSPRWPAIIGVTGFDFGEKPAISLVVPKKKPRTKEKDAWETPITGEQPTGGATCPYGVAIDAAFSGTVGAGEECGGGDVAISGSNTSSCPANTEGDPCTCNCAVVIPITYECVDCPNPEKAIQVSVSVARPDCPDGDWWIFINTDVATGDSTYCGGTEVNIGGSPLLEENVGADPTGAHVFSFDNFEGIHWDITVTVS